MLRYVIPSVTILTATQVDLDLGDFPREWKEMDKWLVSAIVEFRGVDLPLKFA